VEKEENKEVTEVCEENKKVLTLIQKNKTCDYKVEEINKKINAVRKNEEFYMTISVVVCENVLIYFNTKYDYYLEYKYSNEETIEFINFCELNIIELIKSVETSLI
jgi:hypothetical protein